LTRAQINTLGNWVALAGALLAVPTGLILLVRFHIGPEGAARLHGWGLSRLAWVHLHQGSALVMTAAVALHVQLHWRPIAVRLRRAAQRLPGGATRSDLMLYLGSVLTTSAAFAAWLLLPAPLRHPAIDLHHLSALALLPALGIHLRRRIRCLFR